MKTKPEGFPRQRRLRATRDFKRVQSRGRKYRMTNLMVIVGRGVPSGCRVGLVVSRRVGISVVRNRVKRWIREAARRSFEILQGSWDLVVIAHPSAAEAGAAVIAAEVETVFLRITRSAT